MRTRLIMILIATMLSLSFVYDVDADQKKELFWYEVTILHGEKPYEFYGTSTLGNEAFVKNLSKIQFVKLENLVFGQQSGGKIIYSDWEEWDPIKKTYIYLNPKFIIAVHPLKGNPKKSANK